MDQNQTKVFLRKKQQVKDVADEIYNLLYQENDGTLNWNNIQQEIQHAAEKYRFEASMEEEIEFIVEDQEINKEDKITNEQFQKFFKALLVQQIPNYESEEDDSNDQKQEDKDNQQKNDNNDNDNNNNNNNNNNINNNNNNNDNDKDNDQDNDNDDNNNKNQNNNAKQNEPTKNKKQEPNKNKDNDDVTPKLLKKQQKEKQQQKQKEEEKIIQNKLNELKQIKKQLAIQKQTNSNPKIVYSFMNANTNQNELKETQQKINLSTINLASLTKDNKDQTTEKTIFLKKVVAKQNIKSGIFKRPEEIAKAQQLFKSTPILGMIMARPKNEKYQKLFDIFNNLTDNEFDRCPSRLIFEQLDKQIKKNVQFIIIHIESIKKKYYDQNDNPDDQKDQKKKQKTQIDPDLYCWQVKFNQKTLFLNTFKELDNQSFECLEFVFTSDYIHPLEVILWRQKKKDNVLVGEFEIIPEEFDHFEDVEEYTDDRRKLRVKRNQTKILVQKKTNDKSTIQSNRSSKIEQSNYQIEIEYQLIQLSEKVAPQNNYSNTIGSPRSLAERSRRRLVENSKFDPYEWQDDERNKEIVGDIQSVMTDIDIALTVEDAIGFLEGNDQIILILKSREYGSSEGKSNRTRLRVIRVKGNEQVMNLLKTLEEDPNKTVYGNLRTKVVKGRVRKADLDAALQTMQCNAVELIMDLKDDFGDCPFDIMLANCDFGGILEIVQDLNLGTEKNEAELDEFSEKLFRNIKQQLTSTLRLQPLFEFLKAAEKIPDIGIVFAQFAVQYQIEKPPFLEYFDINNSNLEVMDNYEHIMLLGKIVKMLKKYVPDSLLCQESEQAYREAKSTVYFLVPVLPKKMNLEQKRDLLTLGTNFTGIRDQFEFVQIPNQQGNVDPRQRRTSIKKVKIDKKKEDRCLWNIFHECVRRKRWNDFYRGLEYSSKGKEQGQKDGQEEEYQEDKEDKEDQNQKPSMIFQKDLNGRSPLHYLFESAPYEIIMSTLIDFSPTKEAEGVPHIKVEDLLSLVKDDNSNLLHAIASNFRPLLDQQLKVLNKLQEYLNQEQLQELLISETKYSRFTPFILYLNKMARSEKINPIDYDYFNDILDIYKYPYKNFSKQINTFKIRPMILLKSQGITPQEEVNRDLFYHSHEIVAKTMSQLQSSVFEVASKQITWIDWFTVNYGDTRSGYYQFTIYDLVRQGKFDIISNLLKVFEEKVFNNDSKLIKIFPDDFEIDPKNFYQFYQDGEQIIINNKDNSQQLKFTEQEFYDKFGLFYKQYPLEILIGITKTAKESQQKLSASCQQQIEKLIYKIIKKEPRVLSPIFYIHSGKNVVQELIDIGMDNAYQELPEQQQLLYYNFESKISLLDAFKSTKKSLQIQQLRKYSDKIKQSRKYFKPHEEEFRQLFNYLIKANKLSSIFKILPKFKQGSLIYKKISCEILRQWSNQNIKQNKIMEAFRDYPDLFNVNHIQDVYKAALITKNIQQINSLTAIAWSPKYRFNLPICFSTIPKIYFDNSTHYAVCFPLKQFKQLLDDSQDFLTYEDYACMAYTLVRNGMVNKLNLILPKIQNVDLLSTLLREALILKSKQDGVAQFKNAQLYSDPKYFPEFITNFIDLRKIVSTQETTLSQQKQLQQQFKDSLFYKILRPYTVPTKKIPIMSIWSLIPQGALQSLLLAASKKFSIFPELPRSQTFYRQFSEKQIYRQQYDQNLRKTFLTQNLSCLLINKQLEEQDYSRVVDLLNNQLTPEAVGLALEKDPKIEKILKKMYLLPLSTDKVGIIYLLTNAKKAILKSIDLLIQQHLTIRLTKERLQYLSQITERSLKYIKNQFNKSLIEVMKNDQSRVRRIMRSLDHTLKVNQNQQQKSFAIEVLMTVVNSFEQDDFNGIITGHQNLFNSIAVAMMRGKADTKAAISWMATVLNKNEFFEQVATANLPSKDWVDGKRKDKFENQQMKSRIDLEILKIEVEQAQTLLLPTNANANYLLKLAKSKVKPFRKKYQLKKPLNCKHFNCGQDSIQEVSLLEYLCLHNQDQLILKHYLRALKPNNISTEQQQRKWLFIACCSGNIQIFEQIMAELLSFDYAQIFELCIKFPVFNQIIIKFNEKSTIILFKKIFPQKKFTFTDFKDESVQNVIKAFGLQTVEDENQSFVSLIWKHYGELYWEMIEYLKGCSQNQKVYDEILQTIFEFQPKIIEIVVKDDNRDQDEDDDRVEDLEQNKTKAIKLNLIEYSLQSGMPDLGMSAKKIKLKKSPFSKEKVDIFGRSLYNCGNEMLQDEKVLMNSKNQNKVPFYQLFLTIKPLYSSLSLLEQKQIATSIALFYLLQSNYRYDQHIFPNLISNLCLLNRKINGNMIYPFLKQLSDDYQDQKQIYNLMYRYHISGFDKKMNYELSIIKYFELYQKNSNQFWMSNNIQTQYKTIFNVDFLKQKQTLGDPFTELEIQQDIQNEELKQNSKIKKQKLKQREPDEDKDKDEGEYEEGEYIQDYSKFKKEIFERYITLDSIFRQYILLNDPGLIISTKQLLQENTLLQKYDQLFAFIRIGSQMEQINIKTYIIDLKVEDEQDIYHITRQLLGAEIAYCIVDSNYQKYEIIDEDDEDKIIEKNRIVQILSDRPYFIDFLDLARHVNRILDNLRLDNFYKLLIQNQQLNKNSYLNKQLKYEKYFIKGLMEFIHKSIQNEQIKYSFSEKDLLNLLYYDIPAINTLQNDKIFRGFEMIKLCLNVILEIQRIQTKLISNDNFQITLDINLVFISRERIKKQDYNIIKITQINQQKQVKKIQADDDDDDMDQENKNNQFKYEFKIPFAYFEYKGINQILIQDDAINFINYTIKKHQFDQGMLKELIESAKQCSKTLEKKLPPVQTKIYEEKEQQITLISIQVGQQLNPTNITIDNYDILAQHYESLFEFGEFDDSDVKDTTDDLEFDKFEQGKTNLIGRGGQLTIEQECSTKSYFDYQHQLQIKVMILPKAKYLQTYKREYQTKLFMNDYIKTMKSWTKSEEQAELPEKTLIWPIYVENGQIGYDHYNFPLYTFSKFSSIIHQYYEKKYIINYYSYIESYIHPLIAILESPKVIQQPLEDFIYTALDWPFLNYILKTINDYLSKRSSNIIFEIQKISTTNAIKANQMTGYDSILRFGETKYFYHKGFIVVRLSLAFIKGEASTLFPSNKLTVKQKQQTISQENTEYFDKVLNLKGLDIPLTILDSEK